MLLMEANEISQYLKKDYIFKKGDESLVDDTVNVVKVINSKYNVSCLWPLSKLREKLVRMRKLVYAENSENASSAAVDAILFDGTDTWLPETPATDAAAVSTSMDKTGHHRAVCTTVVASSYRTSLPLNSSSFVKEHSPVETLGSHRHQQPSQQMSTLSSSFSDRKNIDLINGSTVDSQLMSSFQDGSELVADTQFMPLSPRTASPSSTAVQLNLTAADYSELPSVDSAPTKLVLSCAPRIKEPLRVERCLRQHSAKSVTMQQQLRPLPVSHCTTFAQTDSSTMMPAVASGSTQTEEMVPEPQASCLVHGMTQTADDELQLQSRPDDNMLLVKLCKDVTGMMLSRLSVNGSNGGSIEIVDRVLRLCQSIRLGIAVVLKAYIPTVESTCLTSGVFADKCKLDAVCMQLVLAIELLVANIEFWCSQQMGHAVTSTAMYDIHRNLVQLVKELSKDMVTFWQACDNKVEVLIRDTSTKITNLLLQLVTESGKMALVAGVCPQTLTEHKRTSLEQLLLQRSVRPDDLLGVDPTIEVKQAFISGCDIMVDETLQDCLQSLEDNEGVLQTSAGHCQAAANNNGVKEEVLQCVFVVLTRCKILLGKLQQTQVELDSKVNDETDKPANYYHHYFERCSAVVSEAHKVTDSITLLTRAVEPFHTDIHGDMLRKICRCSEVVQRAACRLLHLSSSKNCCNSSTAKRLSLELSPLASSDEGSSPVTVAVTNCTSVNSCSGTSLCDSFMLLTPSQSESLRQLIDLVSQATDELCRVMKLRLAQEQVVASASTSLAADNAAGHNAKRMLPVVPGSSVGSGSVVMRCQSARGSDRRSSMLSKHISMLNFPHKKSSEI
jgi:hypothetical protein